jgi:hypothetical protein
MKAIINILFTISIFLFLSCVGECLQEPVTKTEWVTRFEDYKVDTLANYSIVRDNIYFEESYSSEIDELFRNIKLIENGSSDINSHLRILSQKKLSGKNLIVREIEIKNNSDFPANFAIGDNSNFFREGTNDYRTIQPHSTSTFQLSKLIFWNSYNNSNFKNEIIILQEKRRITQKRQIDELLLSRIKINTCETSQEKEQAKYDAIKEQYIQKVDKEKQIINKK